MKFFKIFFSLMIFTLLLISSNNVFAQETDQKHVLILQSKSPWGTTSNQAILEQLKLEYSISTPSQLTELDLNSFQLILIANNQTEEFYQDLISQQQLLESYISKGGNIILGIADLNLIEQPLLSGIETVYKTESNNVISEPNHTIISGELSDGQALQNKDFNGVFVSHRYIKESTLPENSQVILRGVLSKQPTLTVIPIGDGQLIISALTWEFGYDKGNFSFADKAFDDLILSALMKADNIDTIPPSTSINITGIYGNHKYYVSPVEVQLISIDEEDHAPITQYRLNSDLEWKNYGSSLSISEDGIHTLYYRAVDSSGNGEETKQTTIKVDRTAPKITYSYDEQYPLGSEVLVNFLATDLTSHIFESQAYWNGVEVNQGAKIILDQIGVNTLTIYSKDFAGNEVQETINIYVYGKVNLLAMPKKLNLKSNNNGIFTIRVELPEGIPNELIDKSKWQVNGQSVERMIKTKGKSELLIKVKRAHLSSGELIVEAITSEGITILKGQINISSIQ